MRTKQNRVKVISIDLNTVVTNPIELPATGAKQIAFLRFEFENGQGIQHVNLGNWFQIEIDESGTWMPFKMYDRFMVLDPKHDEFHTIKYRNLRAFNYSAPLGTSCWAFIYIFYDMCFDRKAIDVPFETRNIFEDDNYAVISYAAAVAVAAGALTTIFSYLVPTNHKAFLFGFNITHKASINQINWEAHIVYGGSSMRSYARQEGVWATAAQGIPDFVEHEYPKPLEFLNVSGGNQTLAIMVKNNDVANAGNFYGSWNHAIVPVYGNYDLPAEVIG